jgi:hypothetical protein
MKDRAYIEKMAVILAAKAQSVAEKTLKDVKELTGLN